MPLPDQSFVWECMINAMVPWSWWLTDASLTRNVVCPCLRVSWSWYKFLCGQILCHKLVAHVWLGVVKHWMRGSCGLPVGCIVVCMLVIGREIRTSSVVCSGVTGVARIVSEFAGSGLSWNWMQVWLSIVGLYTTQDWSCLWYSLYVVVQMCHVHPYSQSYLVVQDLRGWVNLFMLDEEKSFTFRTHKFSAAGTETSCRRLWREIMTQRTL